MNSIFRFLLRLLPLVLFLGAAVWIAQYLSEHYGISLYWLIAGGLLAMFPSFLSGYRPIVLYALVNVVVVVGLIYLNIQTFKGYFEGLEAFFSRSEHALLMLFLLLSFLSGAMANKLFASNREINIMETPKWLYWITIPGAAIGVLVLATILVEEFQLPVSFLIIIVFVMLMVGLIGAEKFPILLVMLYAYVWFMKFQYFHTTTGKTLKVEAQEIVDNPKVMQFYLFCFLLFWLGTKIDHVFGISIEMKARRRRRLTR